MPKLSVLELRKTWGQFAAVPVDENGDILADYLHFEKGTDQIDVWAWFDKQHPDVRLCDLMHGEL